VVSTTDLDQISKGPRSKELIRHIETEDIDEVREAWIDQLAEISECPECGERIIKAGDRMICSKCDWSLRFRYRAKRGRNPFS
jgi:hypothetical protein